MKTILPAILILLISVFILYHIGLPLKSQVVYNCSLTEISPDIPLEVKTQCRELRRNEDRTSK